jgi:hypothetical protein
VKGITSKEIIVSASVGKFLIEFDAGAAEVSSVSWRK